MSETIRFVDLAAQHRRLASGIDAAIARVLDHGVFIMGPEIAEVERQLAGACGARHALTCSSGTDALLLPLLAWGVGPGDAVLLPSFTFAATAEVVALLGATPVFVDVVIDTFNMDPQDAGRAHADAMASGLRPVGVIAVDLFGLPADYAELQSLADEVGLWLLADSAQSFGASYHGRPVGTLGTATATSFFPAKPLGCYGDGGAVFTDDDELAAVVRSLRVHGQGTDKYDNVRIGLNARLDTMQAAILLEKLIVFEDELATRRNVAERYTEALAGVVDVPAVPRGLASSWAQYTVRAADRDELCRCLRAAGVPTAVYYPTPLHRQDAYRRLVGVDRALPVTDELAASVLSLPVHPYLTTNQQDVVIDAVTTACGASAPASTERDA